MRSDVFRKVALDRLSSPEQLDQLMEVTTPHGWLALAGAGLLLGVAVVWSTTGTLPERVSGEGILVRSGGVYEVVAAATGRVTDVSVRVGDVVTEGRVIGRVAQEPLVDRIKEVRSIIAGLEARRSDAEAFGRRDLALQRTAFAAQRANLDESERATMQAIAALRERLVTQEQFGAQGLVTRQTVLETRQRVLSHEERLREIGSQREQLAVTVLQLENGSAETQRGNAQRLQESQRELARLEQELQRASEIVSPYTGRVLEIMTEQGQLVARGEPVLTVDLTGKSVQDLEAVIYVPSMHGKKLKAGMTIEIAPSTVRREEYGYMLGKVTYVSDFPATPKGMQRVLKNEQLVSTLLGRDAPYEVHADLLPDADTPSAYRWSSSRGPDLKIQSGTLASADITVARRRPIAMVLPLLRRYVGS